MRIRTIKPEFWRSEDIAALDWPTRLLFIGLWSYVDDNGVGRDIEKLIATDLFPLEDDPRDTLANVSRGLARLAAAGLITRYSVGGKGYLKITTWEAHQRIDRPAKPRYPLPTCDDAISRDTLATPSREARDGLDAVPGNREQGTGNRLVPSASAPGSAEPTAQSPSDINAGTIVAAWTEAMKGNNVVPTGGMKGQVGKLAGEMLGAGNDPQRVLIAAQRAGTKGYATIDRELATMAGRPLASVSVNGSAPRRDQWRDR